MAPDFTAPCTRAKTMTDRYGAAKLTTIRRDFGLLRTAIRAHDSEAAERTWLDCERWLGCVEARNIEEHRRIAEWREKLARGEVRAVLAEMDAVLGRGE